MASCVNKFDKVAVAKSLQALQGRPMCSSRHLFCGKISPQASNGALMLQSINGKQGWLNTVWSMTKSFFQTDMLPIGYQAASRTSDSLVRKYGYAVNTVQKNSGSVGSHFWHNDIVSGYNYNHIPLSIASLLGKSYCDAEPLLDGMPHMSIYFCGKHVEQFDDTPSTEGHNPVTFGGTNELHDPLAGDDLLHEKPVEEPELMIEQDPSQQTTNMASSNNDMRDLNDERFDKPADAVTDTPVEDAKNANEENNVGGGGIVLPGFVDWLKNLISHIRMYFQKF